MEVLININNGTNGRDKLARLFQYAAKLAWYTVQTKHARNNLVDKIKNLEYNLATFRKVLRLGRSIDHFYIAMKGIDKDMSNLNLIIRIAKVSYSFFLLYDHLIWASKIGLLDVDTTKWSMKANRFWAITIGLQLVIDIYELYRIIVNPPNKRYVDLPKHVLLNRKDVLIDTVKNMCDIVIPLVGLGIIRTSAGTVGALGVMSSIAALITVINPRYRFSIV